MDLPHLAKRAFRDQISPNVQKAMLLGSPSHQGLKNCGFSQKYIYFSFFDHFLVFGDFLPFLRCWPYFEAGMLFCRYQQHQGDKVQLVLQGNPLF